MAKHKNVNLDLSHVERAIKKAEYYEKAGNKKLAEKFLAIAQKYEEFITRQRKRDEERKQKELYG